MYHFYTTVNPPPDNQELTASLTLREGIPVQAPEEYFLDWEYHTVM
jgi:hypothetical protein